MINADGLTTDEHGNLMQLQRGELEGGDSLNWTGHKCLIEFLLTGNRTPARTLAFFSNNGTGLVRYPNPSMTNNGFGAYHEDAWNGCISRDQLTGAYLMLLATDKSTALGKLVTRAFIVEHSRRFFMFANNVISNGDDPKSFKKKFFRDITGLDIAALRYRYTLNQQNKSTWNPLLCFMDLQMLVNAILIRTFRRKETDLVSFTGKLIASMAFSQTPVASLTWKITDKDHLKRSASIYWNEQRDERGKVRRYQPGMERLTHKIIDKFS